MQALFDFSSPSSVSVRILNHGTGSNSGAGEGFCLWCGSAFNPSRKGNVYCSRPCAWSAINKRRRNPITPFGRCKCCGCDMPRAAHNKQFCTRNCAQRHRRGFVPGDEIKVCEHCHHEFKAKRQNQVYCGKKCAKRSAWRRNPASIIKSINRRRAAKLKTGGDHESTADLIAKWKQKTRFRCFWCSRVFSIKKLTVDHFYPLSKGGKDSPENIVKSCLRCNSRKCNKDPISFSAAVSVQPILI